MFQSSSVCRISHQISSNNKNTEREKQSTRDRQAPERVQSPRMGKASRHQGTLLFAFWFSVTVPTSTQMNSSSLFPAGNPQRRASPHGTQVATEDSLWRFPLTTQASKIPTFSSTCWCNFYTTYCLLLNMCSEYYFARLFIHHMQHKDLGLTFTGGI